MRIVWTARAYERLDELEAFIERDDPVAAERLIARLVERTEALAEFPQLGRVVLGYPGAGLRELVEGNYRIVYRIREDVVEVLTVFEGHQRLREDELGEEPS